MACLIQRKILVCEQRLLRLQSGVQLAELNKRQQHNSLPSVLLSAVIKIHLLWVHMLDDRLFVGEQLAVGFG